MKSIGGPALTVAVLLLSFPSRALCSAAHPELASEATISQQAQFLTLAAQRELARRYAAEPGSRSALRALARDAFATPVRDEVLDAWLRFAATSTTAQPHYEPPARALAQAWRWLHALDLA